MIKRPAQSHQTQPRSQCKVEAASPEPAVKGARPTGDLNGARISKHIFNNYDDCVFGLVPSADRIFRTQRLRVVEPLVEPVSSERSQPRWLPFRLPRVQKPHPKRNRQ